LRVQPGNPVAGHAGAAAGPYARGRFLALALGRAVRRAELQSTTAPGPRVRRPAPAPPTGRSSCTPGAPWRKYPNQFPRRSSSCLAGRALGLARGDPRRRSRRPRLGRLGRAPGRPSRGHAPAPPQARHRPRPRGCALWEWFCFELCTPHLNKMAGPDECLPYPHWLAALEAPSPLAPLRP